MAITPIDLTGETVSYGDTPGALGGYRHARAQTLSAFSNTGAVGDAKTLFGPAVGGNDTLTSSPGNDQMWGDAAVMGPHAHGGANTFAFSPGNRQDMIVDSSPGRTISI